MHPVSREDLIEIANLRGLRECHGLRISIGNGDTEWEGRLVAAYHKLHRMERRLLDGDVSQKETWKRYDWAFHLAMIQACNSKNLLDLHATIFDKYLRHQTLVLTSRGEVAAREHKAMFEAALERDADLAEWLLEEHIRNRLDHTLAAMQGRNRSVSDQARAEAGPAAPKSTLDAPMPTSACRRTPKWSVPRSARPPRAASPNSPRSVSPRSRRSCSC